MSLLLIYPPVVKPCEPPAGLARLGGALKAHGIQSVLLDANLEGFLSLIDSQIVSTTGEDPWTRRAVKNRNLNKDLLKNSDLYSRPDHYRRAVHDLNRLVSLSGSASGIQIGFSNYEDRMLSPLKSWDLIGAAESPERNPFYIYFRRRLTDLLEKNNFSWIGLSVNFLSQALTAFAMIGFLKKENPNLKILLGGGLITSWAGRFDLHDLFRGLVDEVVAGDGEAPLVALCGNSARCGEAYTPQYSAFPWQDYFSPGPILPYSASGGCYWRKCEFCPEKAEQNEYRPVSAEKVISDLASLEDLIKPSLIHFLDNAISPHLMRAMIRHHRGTPWYGFTRSSSDLTDPEFCRALNRSGCTMLQIGIESGDQRVLDDLDKGIDLGMASQVLKNLKEVGIATYVYLLFGTPPENEESARKTLEFTVKHQACIDFINAAIFNLPAENESYPELRTNDFYEGDLYLYRDFTHPLNWGRKAVRTFLENEFKMHPAIRPIILRDPPLFTSNHAPFLFGS
jgi:hypothetical protein